MPHLAPPDLARKVRTLLLLLFSLLVTSCWTSPDNITATPEVDLEATVSALERRVVELQVAMQQTATAVAIVKPRPATIQPVELTIIPPTQPSDIQQELVDTILKINHAFDMKDLSALMEYVHPDGVYVPLKLHTDIDPKSLHSREIIQEVFAESLLAPSLSCIGYNPHFGDQHALVVYGDMLLDWKRLGSGEIDTPYFGLVFQEVEGDWLIRFLYPMYLGPYIGMIVDLEQCPNPYSIDK